MGPKVARRRLNRRDAEEQAKEYIRTHWPRATPLQPDQVVDGQRLCQRVLALKRQCKMSEKKIGPLANRKLAKEYNLHGSTLVLTAPQGQQVNPALKEALQCARGTDLAKKSRGPLLAYLTSCKGLNMTETIGLVKHIAELTPKGKASWELAMGLMKAVRRLNCAREVQEAPF